LVKQVLPLMNPCWLGLILWLSFTCPVVIDGLAGIVECKTEDKLTEESLN